MRMVQNKDFWMGAVAAILVVKFVLPKFAPSISAKI